VPFFPSKSMDLIIFVSVEDGRSIEIKYVNKGSIVEYVDTRWLWTVARELCLLTN
jgi:hypothetical protein